MTEGGGSGKIPPLSRQRRGSGEKEDEDPSLISESIPIARPARRKARGTLRLADYSDAAFARPFEYSVAAYDLADHDGTILTVRRWLAGTNVGLSERLWPPKSPSRAL